MFEQLKREIAKAIIYVVDDSGILTVETDASEFGVAVILIQTGRPVAFFSRTLNPSERRVATLLSRKKNTRSSNQSVNGDTT